MYLVALAEPSLLTLGVLVLKAELLAISAPFFLGEIVWLSHITPYPPYSHSSFVRTYIFKVAANLFEELFFSWKPHVRMLDADRDSQGLAPDALYQWQSRRHSPYAFSGP